MAMHPVTPRPANRSPNRRPVWALAVLAVLGVLALAQVLDRSVAGAEADPQRLTSRPRPTPAVVKPLAVGAVIRTGMGQRRRVVLPEGGVVYLNQNTSIKLDQAQQLTLTAGEVLVEAAALVVKTPHREAAGKRAKFAVRIGDKGTGIVVTRGRVTVNGLDGSLSAGQQLAADAKKPVAAPAAVQGLDWARELLAAENPLVPAGQFTGGALVARDPDGQETRLTLRKHHIDVHIEDGFARTTIDQTYFNHDTRRLPGTFCIQVPPDASLSRLAMYVSDGKECNLMEGGMVERDYGRDVFEEIVYRQKDPALLEWRDGGLFKMRVFPLEGRQEKRILLSYSQKLSSQFGQMTYRFPASPGTEVVRDWSFHARLKDFAEFVFPPNLPDWITSSHQLKASIDRNDLLLDAKASNSKADRDVVVTLTDKSGAAPDEGDAWFKSAEHEGARYLMMRYRPALVSSKDQTLTRDNRKDWVFLFESSGDRDPLLARAQVEVVRMLLAEAEPDDTFAVLAAGTRVRSYAREPRSVTPENVQEALAFLESAHLVGALDLGRALTEATPLLKAGKNPYLVHVGSGIAALGERRADVLAKRLPSGTRYVGVGVGRRWSRDFMKAAAERSGGCFTQINPDEPIAWRAFELAATMNAPRLLNVQVRDEAGRATFLNITDSIAQGEELCAIARLGPNDSKLPEAVTISGSLDGKPYRRVVPVKDVADRADYLPRTWARLEIERLLAADAAKNKNQIIELSKAMYVMTPFTSLLVLENDAMYTQYKVDRGRKDHWALYDCPAKIAVVNEPEDGQPADPQSAAKGIRPTAKQVFDTIVVRGSPPLIRWPSGEAVIRKPIPTGGLAGLTFTTEPQESGKFVSGLTPANSFTSDLGIDLVDLKEFSKFDVTGLGPTLDFSERVRLPRGHYLQHRPDYIPPSPASIDVTYQMLERSPSHLGQLRITGNEVTRQNVILRQVPLYPGQDLSRPVGTALDMIALRRVADSASSAQTAINLDEATLSTNFKPSPRPVSLVYERPSFTGEDRLFSDLVAYAPGMNTSRADVLAILEAEAAPDPRSKPGQIDATARQLLDKARPAGWQTLTIPAEGNRAAFSIVFDGQGRYAWERQLPPGLREQVVCDGKTLLHVYPDLGIGARRNVSRFHRLDFARLVPWVLPSAEDLARGADLRVVGDRTLALIPHGAESAKGPDGKPLRYARVQLVFAADGRLSERQVVEMPARKVHYREIISATGAVRLLGADGNELLLRKATLAASTVPNLKLDTGKLVVLPLPYRTRAHVLQTLKIDKTRYEDLRFEDALTLFAADFAAANGSEALKVFQGAFHGRRQRQLGFYVLLAACDQNLDAEHVDVLAEHRNEPLAQYLALYSSPVLRKHASQWAVGTGQWAGGFLGHLAVSHALYQRWQTGTLATRDAAERARALEYVRRNKGSVFGWALLGLLQDRANDKDTDPKQAAAFHRELAELWRLFEDVPGLAYAARYEHARSLWKSGQHAEARKQFRELYDQTFAEDVLPAIDADFRLALLGEPGQASAWSELLRQTTGRLIAKKRRLAVLTLARQCWQLGDEPMANHLLTAALDGLATDKERRTLRLAGVAFLMETGQLPRADQLLHQLLGDPEVAKRAALWRLAAKLAGQRDMTARELECLERALDAEYRDLPEVMILKAVRSDYEQLLAHYQKLADAMIVLKLRPPADFVARVVRAADRWRALDSDGTAACQAAARILQTLGETDLVWDYLTTPVGLQPGESGPWLSLAQQLSRKGELELADRAFDAAFAAEPTNAQVLWDRAQGLLHAGKRAEAGQVLRRLAEGQWQPRFSWIQTQAQRHIDNR